jgi:hypothetical protein
MIEINLLPNEFKIKGKSTANLPYLQIAAILCVVFILATAFLYLDFYKVKSSMRKIDIEWKKIQPEFKKLSKLQMDLDGNVKVEEAFMEKFVTTQKPLTHILIWLSEALPSSAWLSEVKLDRTGDGEMLLIKGLVLPTDKKSSIELIEDYLHQINFKMPEARLTLTTSRQTIEKTEVTQFTAAFSWGAKPKAVKK